MYEYQVFHVLGRRHLGTLDMTGVSFNDPISGPGQLTGTVTIDPYGDVTMMRDCLQLDLALICVLEGRSILWAGIIVSAPYDDEAQTVAVTATQVSSWLADRLHGQGLTSVAWKAKDQFVIARDLVTYASSVTGSIPIVVGSGNSGVTRDLTIQPQSYVAVDGLIDSMAKLTKGFDWAINARFATDGLPELYLALWYPERHLSAAGSILLSNEPGAGNVQSFSWPNDGTGRKTRIIATGDGDVPKMMVGVDADPTVAKGTTLLREKASSYSGKGITKAATLTANARAERIALADTVGAATVTLMDFDPYVAAYDVGDRVRLRLIDPWLDIDLPKARITERTIHDEDRSATAEVTLTIDVSDAQLPEDAEI